MWVKDVWYDDCKMYDDFPMIDGGAKKDAKEVEDWLESIWSEDDDEWLEMLWAEDDACFAKK